MARSCAKDRSLGIIHIRCCSRLTPLPLRTRRSKAILNISRGLRLRPVWKRPLRLLHGDGQRKAIEFLTFVRYIEAVRIRPCTLCTPPGRHRSASRQGHRSEFGQNQSSQPAPARNAPMGQDFHPAERDAADRARNRRGFRHQEL